jgi:hypothetical protein
MKRLDVSFGGMRESTLYSGFQTVRTQCACQTDHQYNPCRAQQSTILINRIMYLHVQPTYNRRKDGCYLLSTH